MFLAHIFKSSLYSVFSLYLAHMKRTRPSTFQTFQKFFQPRVNVL
jgi:uncharacterized short protein YbdD (DUF466 family)